MHNFTGQQVKVRVLPTSTLPAENVLAWPHNDVFDANGTLIGSIDVLVKLTLNSPATLHKFLNEGEENHRGFKLQWKPRDKDGNPVFLQKCERRLIYALTKVAATLWI
jgi:hypothetical protein